jgi:phage repressor protein C with HTH and peptisase S24 domain
MSELKDRAIEARLAAGYEVPKQWAEALGVSPSAIYQLEGGTTLSLSIKTAAPMAKLSGFSMDWLQHGRGPKYVATRVGEENAAYLTIPVHSAHASAGHGKRNGEITEIGSLLFRPRSLSKRDISEQTAQVWYVTGNSMFPRLREGDAVLFDAADTEPKDGKLYVIEWGGKEKQTYVKRLYHELDGAIRVVSDNPAPEFRDRIVQPGDAGFRVLGRVRWIGSWED